jgi:hypothetical protein
VSGLDLNTLILDGADAARAKALAKLDAQIALVDLFEARFKALAAKLADGSDEAVETAFRQAHLDVFGKGRGGDAVDGGGFAMSYDDWKTTPPADDGIACRKCKTHEAEPNSWLCKDCGEEEDHELQANQ